MRKQKYFKLSPVKKGSFEFHGCYYIKEKEKALLIDGKNGGTIVVDKTLLEEIESGEISDDLRYKLISRGFAKEQNSPSVVCIENCPPRPTFFLLDLTSKCNFCCEYCLRYITGNEESITDLELENNLDKLVDYCRKYHIRGLDIQPWGGEPMLELEKIVRIRERFEQEGIPLNLTMETNGSLITPKAARILKENKVRVGISVDGHAALHNKYRHFMNGKDTFDSVKKGVENLRKAGFESIGGIGVVTRSTLENLDEVLDCLVYDLKFTGFKLTIMHSPSDEQACDYMLNENEIEEFADRLFEKLCDYYRKGIRTAEASVSNRMANLIYRNDRNICVSNGCRGGRRMLSIDKHGTIFLCELMDFPEQAIGTVHEEKSIPEMVEEALKTKDYFTEKRIEKCDECPWRYYCRGGCTAIVQYEKNHVEGVDPISCAFNRAIYPRLANLILTDPKLAVKFI